MLSASHQSSFLLGADVVSDLSTEGAVVHEEHLKILIVPDEELLKPVGEVELGAEVTAETNFGHGLVATELATNAIVNT